MHAYKQNVAPVSPGHFKMIQSAFLCLSLHDKLAAHSDVIRSGVRLTVKCHTLL
jgi:hypothetical protein